MTIISMMLIAALTGTWMAENRRVPDTFTLIGESMAWPKRILWYIATWGALFGIAPSLIEKAGDWQWVAFLIIGFGIVICLLPGEIDESDADHAIDKFFRLMFVVAVQILAVVTGRWMLLFLWIPATAIAYNRKQKIFIFTVTAISEIYTLAIL